MKNTKIMAVLVVLLATALFVGAGSAAITIDTEDVKLTAAPTTVAVGEEVTFELTNITAITGSVTYSLNYTTDDWATNESVGNFPALTAGSSVTLTWTAPAEGKYQFSVFNTTAKAYGKYNATEVTFDVKLPDDVRKVKTGNDVFVYEHIFFDDATKDATKLVKYSDGATPSVINQISGAYGIFYLTEDVVDGQYGTYAVENATAKIGTVSIWYPEISLQAELTTNSVTGATSGDSIDGKTINKNTQVSFLINSPKVAPARDDVTAKIVFTTPAGGQTTYFGTSYLGEIPLSGTQAIVGGMTIGEQRTPLSAATRSP